nr:reverse transcriptase domain-containing protein [Tanacetum cinerariifolium]
MAKMFLGKYFPPSMVTKLRNEITNFRQHPDESLFEAWERYKLSIDRCPNHIMLPVTQIDTFYNRLTLRHHDTINAATAQRSNSSSSITSSSDTKIAAMKAKLAEINKNLMRVLQPLLAKPKTYMLQEPTKVILTNLKANDAILKNMQTNMTSLTNSNLELKDMFGQFMKMNTASPSGLGTLPGNTVTNPKEELKGITTRSGTAYQGPTIPTTSSSLPQVVERETEVTKDTVPPTNNGRTKDVQPLVVQAETPMLNFEPVVAPIIEPVAAPKNCRDPDKFLIPCDFPGMAECLALVDLSASINLMPLSVWNKLSLPELSPTCMALELADRSISRPVRVAEDVFVKVGTFHFLADFVVVDFDADPRVPLILGRYFLKTGRALIDVFEGELTLREYSQEVLGFSDMIASGNPTPYYDPIVSTSSPTLTPFGDSDFLLEEVDAFLALEDDPTSPEVDQSYFNLKGDILLLEAFLNDDPSLPLPNQGNYLPQVRKELKIYEAKNDKSSIDKPLEVELKNLPPHLECAFLEDKDKLHVIIAKYLSDEEKTALITVLKSHKRAITWKLSGIKGINPEFYTHKILMEDDFEPVVQHQRRVNPKIHDVIKKDVLKLLDAGLIYPISDSPWIKKRPHSRVLTERLPIVACLLAYAMHRAHSKEKTLKRCEDTNLCVNWEESHFMVREGIVLGHKISKDGIEVDKAKVNVIAKLHHPTTVKGIRSFLGHVGFYRRFIQDFSKIARPMTHRPKKDTPFFFSKECVEAFQTLKRKLTKAPFLITPD